jgi:hypothetical protein
MLTGDSHLASVVDVLNRRAAQAFEPSAGAKLAARLRAHSLDQALMNGADPATTALLAAHAARLTSPSMRASVAGCLERLARAEDEVRSHARVLPFKAAVRANTHTLSELAATLRGPRPVYARGVAMLRRLVRDGTGPAYADRDGGELALELRAAATALNG